MAAKNGEDFKLTHYTKDYNVDKSFIIPFALDTYGYLGPLGNEFLERCLTRDANGDIVQAKYSKRWVTEAISIALARSNARIVRSFISKCLPLQHHGATPGPGLGQHPAAAAAGGT